MDQEYAEQITAEYLRRSGVRANVAWDTLGGWAGGHTHWTGSTITFPCDDLHLSEEVFRFVAAHEVGHVVHATTSTAIILLWLIPLLFGVWQLKRAPLWFNVLVLVALIAGRNYVSVPPRAVGEWLANRHAVSLGATIPVSGYDGPIAGGVIGIIPDQDGIVGGSCLKP